MSKALQNAKKRGEHAQQMKKGLVHTTIPNTKTITEQDIQTAIKTLLKPMIKDQQMLNIMAERQNWEKLKNRTEYTIQAQGKTGTLLQANLYNNTIDKAIKDINDILHTGDEVKKGYDKYTKQFKTRGWQNAENKQDGTIERTQLKIVLQI